MSAETPRAGSSRFLLDARRRQLFHTLLSEEGIAPQAERQRALAGDTEELPLSFAQERLWFLDRFQPGMFAYNVPWNFRVSAPMNVPALRESINEIVRRHESLRTTFRMGRQGPVQVIAPALRLEVPEIDLRSLPAAAREAEVRRLATEEFERPFDLANGPLLRVRVVHVEDARHEILVTVHHIVADGPSMEVFFSELWALYNAFCGGRRSQLPLLRAQYRDFAQLQRSRLQGEELARQMDYWRQQFAGVPTFLPLPADRPRPPVQTYRGAMQNFTIDRADADALLAIGQREGATPFMTFLTVFNVLLFRYTQQAHVVVGTPIANRQGEYESLIGFFVNTLVLVTDLRGDPTFSEALQRVRATALGAYAHPDLPFERLVDELQPERNLGHNPLFQAMFTLQKSSAFVAADDNNTALPEFVSAKFDLQIYLLQTPERFVGAIEYNTDLFDHSTALRITRHFTNLVAAAAANPATPISRLPLLDADERHQLLVEWNPPAPATPPPAVHEPVAAQAARTPDAIAVTVGAESLSYRELDRRANQLARHLIALGIEAGTPVGIHLPRSLDLCVAVLAVLRSGGAELPLDIAYPPHRVAFMLEDARVPVIVTDSARAANLPPHTARVVCVDADAASIAAHPGDAVDVHVSAEQTAYIIFTSGSTGVPKGVVVPHRVLANLIEWQLGASSEPAGVTTQFAPLSFDVAQQEMFSTWWAGGRLVVATEDDRRDPVRLLKLLEREGVARVFLPFVALQHLASAASALPATTREVIAAGEQLQITPQIRQLFKASPHCRLRNQYGPSETHIVSEYTLDADPASWPVLPPIGRPIAGATFYVLDDCFEPVPVGVAGELYIGGVAVASGYLRRPEITAQRFLSDPYGAPGSRFYRTGDVARFRADGNIEFLGRRDAQVKVRGYRIEPGEIETLLCRHPAVTEAAVVARGKAEGRHLVAFYVPAGPVTFDELREHVRRDLPDYMVPAMFVPLRALPTTPSGKIDREALPDAELRRADFAKAARAPRTDVERELAGIFAQVLSVDAVGIDDDFFDLGGHSLSATQVISRVRDVFGADLPVLRLFESPTVEGLVPVIAAALLEQVDSNLAAELLAEIEATAAGSMQPSSMESSEE
jgi:amino acid adenylation domain-containing protein